MTHSADIVVVLDNIRSALNVGAIFRTCDGAGVRKLFLCGITPYPPHNRIPKTALGAIEFVDWERSDSTQTTILTLKQQGYQIVSVEQTTDSKLYTKIAYDKPTALIFGHEITGVGEEVIKNSDHIVELPMFGQKNSLNVATTVGIITYHAIMSNVS